MPKQGLLILTVMLIVFSLTLIGGGGNYMLFMSPSAADDKYIQASLFWLGTLVSLVGIAGFLAGLVGLLGVILVHVAELKNQERIQEELKAESKEQETR